MAQKPTPRRQPIAMVPVVAQAIDGMVESAEEQHINMRSVRDRPYVLDDAIVARMMRSIPSSGMISACMKSNCDDGGKRH